MSSGLYQKVWVITGTSKGLGRELALSVLSRGDRVIATARSSEQIQGLQESYPETCSLLQLDVTDTFDVLSAKAKQAIAVWGRVDVLVNNAGDSLVGTVEEAGVDGLMEVYKVNVFGSVNVTNSFLPYMRERRYGTVVFIGSRSGWRTNIMTSGPYSSSKAALHAIADALAEELRPLNIRVLNVVSGGLRTGMVGSLRFSPNTSIAHPVANIAATEVPEYAEIRRIVRHFIDMGKGVESGDPKKAAVVIVDVVRGDGLAEGRAWNGTLILGSDAERDIRTKCEGILKNLEEWEDVVRSIDW